MRAPIKAALPLYRQVVENILLQLAEGSLKPGQFLPSEWDLARQWQVSQGTVRKGLTALVEQGVLGRQQGVGTFVTDKNPEWGDYPLAEAAAVLQAQPALLWPRAEVLSVTTAPADDETAVKLQLRLHQPVWCLGVLWRCGHQAVALDEALLPVARLPDLNVRFVQRRISVYPFLQLHYGMALHTQEQWLAQLPSLPPEAARQLKVGSVPVWHWCRLSGDAAGVPLEWRRRYLLPGQWQLQLQGAVKKNA